MQLQNPAAPPRFGGAYWSRVLETFVIAAAAVFVAQWSQLQDAVNAGDWDAAKKVGLALGFGLVTALGKAIWLALKFPGNGEAT